jgi:type VI secretion system protein ImpA
MPSPPAIDIEALLLPIPGDNPAGESLPFAVREKLDEFRKEINPDSFDADDPLRPDQPKPADWPAIVRLCEETLTNTSKDLLASARLLEGLVRSKGFAGLRDGLQLMRRLLADCWDRINPSIEDGDLEVRAAPFNWLDDPDRGARFPTSVRMAPIIELEGTKYSWLDWKQLQEGKGPLTAGTFDRAVTAASREDCQTLVDDLTGAQQELQELTKVLTEKLGEVAPGMVELRKALEESLTLAQQMLKKKGPPPGAEEAAGGDEEETAAADGDGAPAGRRAGRVTSRDDAYRLLSEAATLLQSLEPHSPIPYLVQRAIELGSLPFPKLIKALIRDGNVLTELNRELGIKDEDGAPPAEES